MDETLRRVISVGEEKTVLDDCDQQTIIVTPLQVDDVNHISVMGIAESSITDGTNEPQITLSSGQLDMEEYVSVEVFDAANEIEINTDDCTVTEDIILPGIHNHRDLPYNFGLKDTDVPDTVAVETVVTTSFPRRRKQKQTILQNHEMCIVSDDICGSDTDATLWGHPIKSERITLPNTYLGSDNKKNNQIVEVFASGDGRSFVTLSAPDIDNKDDQLPISITTNLGCSRQEASIREITKRERDRLKKQVMRTDPQYRLVEKEKSRARMKNKRNEPGYRDKERVKDRIRRRIARQKNTEQRQRERERDKLYKKTLRQPPLTSVGTSHDDTPYSIDLSDIHGL